MKEKNKISYHLGMLAHSYSECEEYEKLGFVVSVVYTCTVSTGKKQLMICERLKWLEQKKLSLEKDRNKWEGEREIQEDEYRDRKNSKKERESRERINTEAKKVKEKSQQGKTTVI